MTGSETNQQHALWVDRCRQQLERGAAGNALIAWMLSEGIGAETAAAILETAQGKPASASAEAPPADHDSGTAPGTAPQGTGAAEAATSEAAIPSGHQAPVIEPSAGTPAQTPSPEDARAPGIPTVPAAPATPASPRESRAAAFARAFNAPGRKTELGTPPAQESPHQSGAEPTADPASGAPQTAASLPPQATPQPVAPEFPPASPQDIPAEPEPMPPTAPSADFSPSPPQPATAPAQSTPAPAASSQQPSPGSRNPFGDPRPTIAISPAPEKSEPAAEQTETFHDSSPEPNQAAPARESDFVPAAGVSIDADHETVRNKEKPAFHTASVPESVSDYQKTPADDHFPDAGPEQSASEPEAHSDVESVERATAIESEIGDASQQLAENEAETPPPVSDADETAMPPESVSDVPLTAESDTQVQPPMADETRSGSDPSVPDMSDESSGLAESLEDQVVDVSVKTGPGETPVTSYREFVEHEERRQREAQVSHEDEAAAIPADEADDGGGNRSTEISAIPASGNPEKQVEARYQAADGTAGDDGNDPLEALHAAGEQEPAPASSAAAQGHEAELARAIRDAERYAREAKRESRKVERDARKAERDAARKPAPQVPQRDLKTEEEFIAAAREMGISFRDSAGRDQPHLPDGEEGETARAARELGISFRDDPANAAAAAADDPMAKAARELGISFRDVEPPEAKPKSTLQQYWPIILIMAIAAIGMPLATAYFMLNFD